MIKAKFVDGSEFKDPVGKVVCVGRNYAAHAKELNNPVPTTPLLFIKPSTSVVDIESPMQLPRDQGEVHYETELALLIGSKLKDASEMEAQSAIAGIGVALDLTLRELQSQLKDKGHPWEISKSFDGACPLSTFIKCSPELDLTQLKYQMNLNGELRQSGDTREMITPIVTLIALMSRHFTLLPGDVVLTGTPAGVGVLNSGDQFDVSVSNGLSISGRVA